MDLPAITKYITESFAGLDILMADDDVYFYYDPEKSLPVDRRFPIATLMTTDAQDRASNLSRPGVFRLNIGIGKETYRALFGAPPGKLGGPEGVDTGHDYTVLDRLMPHPVYAAMSWACVLNPSDGTFDEKVKPLLTDAYEAEVRAYGRRKHH